VVVLWKDTKEAFNELSLVVDARGWTSTCQRERMRMHADLYPSSACFYQWGSGNKDTPVNAFSTGMKKEVQATKLETTSVLWPTTSCRRHRKNPSTCIDHDDQEKCDPKEQVAY
jgi:hypothetical protein